MFFVTGFGRKMIGFATAGAACICACLTDGHGAQTGSSLTTSAATQSDNPADPYLWLEDVTAEKALTWVRAQNAISTRELESAPNFEPIRKRLLSILDSKEKIPYVSKHGIYYYNFWRDDEHVRGLWRRTTFEEFKKAAPRWETVLDIDALAQAEKENW